MLESIYESYLMSKPELWIGKRHSRTITFRWHLRPHTVVSNSPVLAKIYRPRQ